MRSMKTIVAVAVAGLVLQAAGNVRAEGLPFTVSNRLRLEYDDNIRQRAEDKDSSVKIVEQLQLMTAIDMEQTFLTLRYSPSIVYWFDRSEDSSDIHHEADVSLTHRFSPQLALSLTDTFRYADLPELRADDSLDLVLRRDNTYIFNVARGSLAIQPQPATTFKVDGAYTILRYDDDFVATRDDYDIMAAGLSMEQVLTAQTSLSLVANMEDTEYKGDLESVVDAEGNVIDRGAGDRGSKTYQVGAGLQHTFTPQALGSFVAGFQTKDFNASNTGSSSMPYATASMTVLPSPRTRLSAGASHSMYEADVYPFSNQERTSLFASIGQDVTAKLDFSLNATYIMGKYDAEETVETVREIDVIDGDDDAMQVSSRLRYNVARNNYLELGYQYTDIASDVRDDYSRNRYWVGWQTRL
jgi:hypothetical protein